jgi:hypothetical protein
MKILWFQDTIKASSLVAAKALINANKSNFEDFDSVKDVYVDLNCMLPPTENPRAQPVASFAHGDCGGNSCLRQNGRGQGPRTNSACQGGLTPQSNIDRMTHIMPRDYTTDEYQKLTPAEKYKLWLLRNPGKILGTGPTRHDCGATSVVLTSTPSTGKHLAEEDPTNEEVPTDNSGY